jgi:DNA polymerase-3 subunit gamma/tau
VAQFLRPIAFRPGVIEFEPAPGAPSSLAQRLSSRLKDWTGQPWMVVAQGGGGAETEREREGREKALELQAIAADPFVQSVMKAFPGTEIVGVRRLATPAADGGEAEED